MSLSCPSKGSHTVGMEHVNKHNLRWNIWGSGTKAQMYRRLHPSDKYLWKRNSHRQNPQWSEGKDSSSSHATVISTVMLHARWQAGRFPVRWAACSSWGVWEDRAMTQISSSIIRWTLAPTTHMGLKLQKTKLIRKVIAKGGSLPLYEAVTDVSHTVHPTELLLIMNLTYTAIPSPSLNSFR